MSEELDKLPQPKSPPILASDAERDQTIELLRGAVVEGRLTLEEFSDRVGLAQLARTDEELAGLCRDLPVTAVASALAGEVEPHQHRTIFSELQRRGSWEIARRSVYRCICGTVELDLTQARLAAEQVEMEIHNLCGTVTVIAPEGIDVVVTGGGAFSSQRIEPPAGPPIAAAPRLLIRASGAFGTLHVRHSKPSGRGVGHHLRP